MKTALFILIVLSHQCVFAQGIEKARGLDSVTGREWIVTSFVVPSGEPCLIRKEYVSDKKRQLIFLSCSDSSELQSGPGAIPEACKAVYKRNKAAGMHIDSAYALLRACADDLYRTAGSGYTSDTIYIEPNSPFFTEPSKNERDRYFADRIEIYDSLNAFRYVTYYYAIDELKNTCLSGSEFRVEHRESWKNGKEDGEWVYYDPNGRERFRVIYSEGKRVN
jgi:hypothetical protein